MMARGRSAVIVLMVAYQGLPCHAAASRRSVCGASWRDAWPSVLSACPRRSSGAFSCCFSTDETLAERLAARSPYRGAH